jgi:hypothetical protein
MKHRQMLWTHEDDAILRQGAVAGQPVGEIARKVGRSESAIRARAYVLRVALRRPKWKYSGPDQTT